MYPRSDLAIFPIERGSIERLCEIFIGTRTHASAERGGHVKDFAPARQSLESGWVMSDYREPGSGQEHCVLAAPFFDRIKQCQPGDNALRPGLPPTTLPLFNVRQSALAAP